MSQQEILSDVKEIMLDVFDIEDADITEATTAEDVEEWDSLSHIRLMVAIEKKYRFKFKNSEIESLTNVGDLVKMIQAKIN